jgi:hypothetical protein
VMGQIYEAESMPVGTINIVQPCSAEDDTEC